MMKDGDYLNIKSQKLVLTAQMCLCEHTFSALNYVVTRVWPQTDQTCDLPLLFLHKTTYNLHANKTTMNSIMYTPLEGLAFY